MLLMGIIKYKIYFPIIAFSVTPPSLSWYSLLSIVSVSFLCVCPIKFQLLSRISIAIFYCFLSGIYNFILTNYMAYETRRFNAAFTRDLQ